MKNPEPLFFILRGEGVVAGPYDVVQMAGLLRRKIISGETMTRRDGEDDWKAFSWQPQFSVVREMPADAVSTRVIELDDAAEEARQGPVPMPSRETIIRLVGLAAGSVAAGLAAFVVAWLDPTLGVCLVFVGMGAALVALCLTIARIMDEDGWTQAKIFFLPYYDIYYLLCNVWAYFPMMCIRFIGGAVVIGATLGLACHR